MTEPGKLRNRVTLSHVGRGRGWDAWTDGAGVGERASVANVFIRNTSVSNFLLGFRRSELHVYSNTLSLCVGYYTLFFLFSHSSLATYTQTYKNVHFLVVFSLSVFLYSFILCLVHPNFYLCLRWAYLTIVSLLVHCQNVFFMYMFTFLMLQSRSRHSLCNFLCYISVCHNTAISCRATVEAISWSEVFNASSTLMNYSNEPDIFATNLQRRMPLLFCYYFQLINV